MHYTIYKITNLINDKYYIGKHITKNLDDGYMGSGKLIRAAIKKYGKENFKKEILFDLESEELMNLKEKELVVISEETYNLCPGGHGGFGYINNNQEIVIERNRKIAKNRDYQNTDYMLKKANAASIAIKEGYKNGTRKPTGWNVNHVGKKRSEETKSKMSKSHSGTNNSQFGTFWITNGIENKKIKKDVDNIPEGWYKGRK